MNFTSLFCTLHKAGGVHCIAWIDRDAAEEVKKNAKKGFNEKGGLAWAHKKVRSGFDAT
jgi:hypothetical protein